MPEMSGAAVELREAAAAQLAVVKGFTEPDGTIKAENQAAYDAAFEDFQRKDAEFRRTMGNDGSQSAAREAWEFYTGKVSGTPIRFAQFDSDVTSRQSLGRQFVQSDTYKALKDRGVFEGSDTQFRSDRFVLPTGPQGAASDIIQTESGGPGNALVQPYRPGIVLPLPQAPTIVRSLFANEDMPSGDTIEYAAQVGFDNAAAAVAQTTAVDGTGLTGGVKPQSSIAWEERTAPARWIATWMAATRQALSDDNQLASLIDNQGRLMIRIAEDDALVNGNGTPPNISGILDQPSIQTLDLTGEDNLDGIRTARRLVKTGLSRLDPTFIIINPVDSEEVDLLKDGNGLYRGGNPIGNFGFEQPIWRLTRAESEAIAEGTAIVGARAGATVYERQPISVLIADQHADFFVRNLKVILFEERLAFPIYFPTAFVEVTFGDWVSGS